MSIFSSINTSDHVHIMSLYSHLPDVPKKRTKMNTAKYYRPYFNQ